MPRSTRQTGGGGFQEAYNLEHGIEARTIVKEIHDINERLRSVAEATEIYVGAGDRVRGVDLATATQVQVEELLARMEAEMRTAGRNLEFERAAVLRDEIQQIRLRVLEQDASTAVARAAERAATGHGRASAAGPRRPAGMEVTTVAVVPATDEPDDGAATAADWLPGIRDEHEDDGGWQARWLERPTWDRTVTPNVIRRTGQRPPRRRR